MSVQVFGIRHHGPGCARSLRAALDDYRPDVVLVEGPPDADEILPLLDDANLQPPVALLVYPPDNPSRAVFFPFAEFSPEWQALKYARSHGIPARFMDLPQRHYLAFDGARAEKKSDEAADEVSAEDDAEESPAPPEETCGDDSVYDDPIGALALAAGYRDRELWWEVQIEQRIQPAGLFQGIMEAMTALRSDAANRPLRSRIEPLREAYMRQEIRRAESEKFARIAVVCGAWHAPVLIGTSSEKEDRQLLKGLPKTKVVAAWAPWTYSRLAYRSGYGAGIESPGWYDHLWTHPQGSAIRWIAAAARLLRGEDLDASSASVIEATRLADALAAMRELPMPGMAELTEAIQTVLCHGETAPLALIRQRLEIGERMGQVPDSAPAVPLQRDLEAEQKRLRLKPTTEIVTHDFDLRKETDRERSRLFHRLAILGVPWGVPEKGRNQKGTFHELWRTQWQVEFAVRIIEASVFGTTVASASVNKLTQTAAAAQDLPTLTELLDQAILAELPDAIDAVLQQLQEKSAVAADVRRLMESLPRLVQVVRYGDVRQQPVGPILSIAQEFFARIIVGVKPACHGLADDAAEEMAKLIGLVDEAVSLLARDDWRDLWQTILWLLADDDALHGILRGGSCRLLLGQRVLSGEELHRRARLSLAHALPPMTAAAWLQGLLSGGGLALVHEEPLWEALDAWVRELSDETFVEVLPLVRRSFAAFQPPERRAVGDKVGRFGKSPGSKQGAPKDATPGINTERARLVLPVLAQILGAKNFPNDCGERP